ncbi:helix-turn-helix domain-containing protein [Paenibacillus sp. B01]|uniref:helix-turn-helix domain-containing protein n=1 Tax=Paenibacillus sp. B01 TaxID=2660554 RepID=UPI00129BBABA|nr:AraC family transcriptional regulator [Paenibacillus sp. B01]QGG55651.1 helix-turn-helix domain-containing protein [Paenibacillus sp. B01]
MLRSLSVHLDDFIPGWRTQSERIPYHVLILVLEGNVSYRIDGRDHVAEPGDLLLVPAGTRRAGSTHPSGPHRKFTATFNFDAEAGGAVPLLRENRFIRFKPRHFPYLEQRFERLFEEFRSSEAYGTFVCEAILLELLGLAARELDKPELTPIQARYVERMKRHLMEHYREQVEIRDLARLIGRSPNYAASVFRETIGLSPIRYVHQLRVAEAGRLLLHSDMTVARIAEYLGYYDTSYFFRMFKKHTSLSPTDYIARGGRRDGRPPLAD